MLYRVVVCLHHHHQNHHHCFSSLPPYTPVVWIFCVGILLKSTTTELGRVCPQTHTSGARHPNPGFGVFRLAVFLSKERPSDIQRHSSEEKEQRRNETNMGVSQFSLFTFHFTDSVDCLNQIKSCH
jgi:hypothetical protein